MAIESVCSNPGCREKLGVGDELAGKKARCPKRRTVMDVPKAGGTPAGAPFGGFEMTLPDSEQDKPSGKSSATKEAEKPSKGTESDASRASDALDAFLDGKRGKHQPFGVEQELANRGMGVLLVARDQAIQRR